MKKTKEDALKTKQQILEVSHKLFLEKGYEGTSLKEVVEACGMSRGAAYWHYSGKDELYIEVVRSVLEEIKYDKQRIAKSKLNLVAKLTQILVLPLKDAANYRLVNRSLDLGNHYPQLMCLNEELQQAKADLIILFEDILKAENVAARKIKIVTHILYYLFEGLHYNANQRKITKKEVKEMIEQLAETL